MSVLSNLKLSDTSPRAKLSPVARKRQKCWMICLEWATRQAGGVATDDEKSFGEDCLKRGVLSDADIERLHT